MPRTVLGDGDRTIKNQIKLLYYGTYIMVGGYEGRENK